MGLFDIFGGAAGKAGSAQEQAASEALALQREMYNTSRADLAPYLDTGKRALGNLNRLLLDGDMTAFEKTPGYDFRFNEGMRALENSANARGMLGSGATAKALQKYGQDIGSSEFDKYISRNAMLAGLGQNATGAGVGVNTNFGQMGGQSINDAGAARASSYVGPVNQLMGLLNTGAYTVGRMYGK